MGETDDLTDNKPPSEKASFPSWSKAIEPGTRWFSYNSNS
jgi:hypothetical protein